MNIQIRKNIRELKPYEPGKPIEELSREIKMPVKKIVKLASNENPMGPSPKAITAMKNYIGQVNRYPDGSCFYLKKKLAGKLAVSEKNLIFGNGSDELLDIIAKVFLHEEEEAIIAGPSFLEYAIIAKTRAAKVKTIPMIRDYRKGVLSGFRYDIDCIMNSISSQTKIIFLGNPDNPTGAYLRKDFFRKFFARCPKHVLVVIDEAYRELVDADDYIDTTKYIYKNNVIILRTFSKAYGLAGLRIGYAIASKEIISWVDRVRQPFNVNMIAQQAAVAALDDAAHVKRVKKITKSGREFLVKNLRRLGLDVIEAPANFILLSVKGMTGTELFQSLLPQGIIIRDMKPYCLENWARVSVGTMQQNRVFIEKLKGLGLAQRHIK
jgi:histidinol-phosphate aminotransferase